MEKQGNQNIQDAFLNAARRDRYDVILHMMNGSTLTGTIKSFDKFSLLLVANNEEILVFKHAVSTISSEKKSSNNLTVTYLGRKTDNI